MEKCKHGFTINYQTQVESVCLNCMCEEREEQRLAILKEEKKECDHIVGVQDGDGYEVSDKLIFLSEYDNQVNDYFKYCPECGEKLNLK